MLLGAAVLALVPILVTSILIGGGADQLARDSLTHTVQAQLTSLREVRKQQVRDYVGGLVQALQGFAASTTVVDSYKDLRQAYVTSGDRLSDPELLALRDSVKVFYEGEFAAEYAKRNPGKATGLAAWVAGLDADQLILQKNYIVDNPNPLGAKDKLVQAPERTAFAAAHMRYHPSLATLREKLGLYDIFLIDPQTDRVIYTVLKELDFASSLADGIAAKTGLGEVYRKVKAAAGKPGTVALSDYAPYFASYDDQASFVAVPIMEDDHLIGVLAAQIPLDKITAILTANRDWKKQGFGNTGETFLVGSDFLMRTDSRFILENKADFLKVEASKITAAQLAIAEKKSTSIGVVKVESDATRPALAGEEGFRLITDYRGVSAFAAYAPLDLYGLKWALVAKIDQAEALAGANDLGRQTLLRTVGIAVVMLLLAAGAAYWMVRSITKPVNELSDLVKQVAAGNDEVRSTVTTGDELQELGDTFNKLLDERIATLREIEKENEAMNDSVVGLLRTMLELSKRNLTVRAAVTSDIVGTVADSVNMLTDATASALRDVQGVAMEVAASSERMRDSSLALSDQAHTDREAIMDMTRDIEQAATLMQRVADLAEESRQAAGQATSATVSALQSVTTTVGEMGGIRTSIGEMEKRIKRLGERSQEISQIVTVINSLSERTHVLALNASMQAAMAGEAGRGFAVVTEEVQRLADASRSATLQIAQLAQNIQLETSETVAALNRTVAEVVEGSVTAEASGSQMRATEAATASLANAVQRIANESAQQLELARRLAERAEVIIRSTDKTELVVRGTVDDATALSQSSGRLVQVVAEFKLADSGA